MFISFLNYCFGCGFVGHLLSRVLAKKREPLYRDVQYQYLLVLVDTSHRHKYHRLVPK